MNSNSEYSLLSFEVAAVFIMRSKCRVYLGRRAMRMMTTVWVRCCDEGREGEVSLEQAMYRRCKFQFNCLNLQQLKLFSLKDSVLHSGIPLECRGSCAGVGVFPFVVATSLLEFVAAFPVSLSNKFCNCRPTSGFVPFSDVTSVDWKSCIHTVIIAIKSHIPENSVGFYKLTWSSI